VRRDAEYNPVGRSVYMRRSEENIAASTTGACHCSDVTVVVAAAATATTAAKSAS